MSIDNKQCASCHGDLGAFAFWLPKVNGDVCLKCFKEAMREMEKNGVKKH